MKTKRLSEATEEYLNHLIARNLANSTIKNNRQVLNQALRTWGDVYVGTIDDTYVDRLFATAAWAARTRNLYLQNIRSFFKWCRLRKFMAKDYDPTEMWNNQKASTNVDKLRLPVERFAELLDAAPHPRDRAICALGLFTFCRGSEIATMRIGDLDFSRGELKITRHKTHDEDVLPVSSELATEMARWLNFYRDNQGVLLPEWYLAPAKNPDLWVQGPDGRLVQSKVMSALRPYTMESKPYRAVQRALKGIGVSFSGEGAHTLRRSGARALADSLRDQGYDSALLRVASMCGHKSTKVTEHYIGWGLERTQRNEMIAGKPLFPGMVSGGGLRVVGGSHEGSHARVR